MKTTVQHISDTKVALRVKLDTRELEAAEHVALAKLSRKIKVPGFRKGHVPLGVAAKHVDSTMLAEQSLEDALSRAVADAFTNEKIQPLERPSVSIEKFEPSKSLEFTAEAEIMPQITLGDYRDLKTKKPVTTVQPEAIDDVVERMRKGFAEKKPVDRAAQIEDEVVIDYVGKKDGVAFDGGSANNYALVLGSDSFIPGFEQGIIGHNVNDVFELPLQFPDSYPNEYLKGASVVFDVTLHAISEVVPAELTDEFAAKCGPFTSVNELKEDIKRELTARQEQDNEELLRDNLVQELAGISTVPIPELLVRDQIESLERDIRQNILYRGMSIEAYYGERGFSSIDDWRDSELKELATKRVRAGLVLAELGRAESITVSDEEIDGQISQYLKQYGTKKGVAEELQSERVRQNIASSIATEKAVQRLVDINTA